MNKANVKKISYLIAPLIIILLIVVYLTLNNAAYYISNNGIVIKNSFLHIKETSGNIEVYVNGNLRGRSSQVITFNLDNNQNNNIYITLKANDGRQWNKNIVASSGSVHIYYPILYPEKIDFSYFNANVLSVYPSSREQIMYTHKVNDQIHVSKISFTSLLMNTNINNTFLSNITSIVKEKKFNLIPSYSSDHFVIIVNNEKGYIIKDKGIIELRGHIPSEQYRYFWSPNDSYLIVQSLTEIVAYPTDGSAPIILYRLTNNNERIEIQYVESNYLLFKHTLPERIRLLQVDYQGNYFELDLPNFDNIKKNNLERVFNFSFKSNDLLIQTEKNLYIFNPNTYQFRKLNLYQDEKILALDSKNQIIITFNKTAPTQYRLYQLTENKNTSFVIEEIDQNDIQYLLNQENTILFNYGQNLILNLDNKIILIDSDGANKKIIQKNSPQEKIIKAYKYNLTSFLIKLSPISSKDEQYDNLNTIKIAKIQN